jgi:hypothetical protein
MEECVSDCHSRLKFVIAVMCIVIATQAARINADIMVDSHIPDKSRLDTLEKSLPFLEEKVLSTLLFGGSAPVSVSGDARLKGTHHLFTEYPQYLGPHLRSETSSDSVDGEREAFLPTGGVRLGMVVQPSRSFTLWSKLGFTSKMTGNRIRTLDATNNGFSTAQTHYYSGNLPVAIFEDMCAGVAVTTVPVSFWIKMGSILWTEASPLTIWKAEPRKFAWEYLEYEEEQPASEYYKTNVSEGEGTGRSAWNKKAFNGLNLESISLPLDFYVDLLYAKFSDYDLFERECMDFSGDLGYSGEEINKPIIQTGYGDSYHHAVHARIAKKLNDLTLGVNYSGITCSEDIIYAQNPFGIYFNSMFNLEYSPTSKLWATAYNYITDANGNKTDSIPLDCGKGFYKQPKAFSIDLKGKLSEHFTLRSDIGVSRIDTTWIFGDTVRTTREKIPLTVQKTEYTSSDLIPALYANLEFASKNIDMAADLAYMQRGFYSPFSFVNPMDAFFAFGSNLVGEGTFSAKTEASPYCQNMAGAQVTIKPKVPGQGHFSIKYGQHFQPQTARDLLFFPYRLNGMDLNSVITSSYNMDGLGTVDYPIYGVKYNRRLGDESYDPQRDLNGNENPYAHIEESPDKGGLHADFLSMYEAFVPYDDPVLLLNNIKSKRGLIAHLRQNGPGDIGKVIKDNGDTITVTNAAGLSDENGFVPMHRKYTGNLEFDAAYDIGPLVHYKNKMYLSGYIAINGISTALKLLDLNEKDNDMLLWSSYYRFEPAIALTNGFYLDILLGYENWRSNKSWMNLAVGPDGKEDMVNPIVKKVPINYKDRAYGVGFDWDVFDRTALHFRCKWLTHTDVSFTDNNYQTYLTSLELTTFF